MKKLILAVAAVSVLETVVCGLSLPLIIAYIGRLLFGGKLVGMKVTLGKLIGFEAVAFGAYILIPLLGKSSINLWKLAMFLICTLLVIIIQWYDDANYIYIEEED